MSNWVCPQIDLSEEAIEGLVMEYSPNPSYRICYKNGLKNMLALVEAFLGCSIEEAGKILEVLVNQPREKGITSEVEVIHSTFLADRMKGKDV